MAEHPGKQARDASMVKKRKMIKKTAKAAKK